MASQKTLKVASIGMSVGHAGSIGPERASFTHNWKQMDGVEVVAYCEEEKPEVLKDAAVHHPEANVYTSVDELIAKEDFDVASVVLTPRDLPGVGIKLAEAGKHIFMDKQVARTSAELIPLVKAVRKSGVKTFVGYPISFHPAMQDLKQMIGDGILGKPLDIESRQVFWKAAPGGRDPSTVPYLKDTEGRGVLHYVGCHHLETMRYLMGCEIKSVQAMTGRPVGVIEEPLEDVAIIAMEYENGAYGSMHAAYTKPSILGPQGYDSALVYRGLEGWANWAPVMAPQMEVFSAVPEWSGAPERTFQYDLPAFAGYGKVQWMHAWLEHFIDAIRADTEPYVTVEDGLKILQSIDAAYKSADTGRRVEVNYDIG